MSSNITEFKFLEVSAVPLLVDGTFDGRVAVLGACSLFKVGYRVFLKSSSQNPLEVKINRFISDTEFYVGAVDKSVINRMDVSAYLVADSATISSLEQPRTAIKSTDVLNFVYTHEPAMAFRNLLVDDCGNSLGQAPTNPLHVQLADGSLSIGTVNAELEVQLSHQDDSPDLGDVHDSVRVGDGEDQLEINPDGSIPVTLVSEPIESIYAEVTSVPASTSTVVVSYTAPIGKKSFLQRVSASGTNIARYTVKRNGITIDKDLSYFSGPLSVKFDFSNGPRGLKLAVGDVVLVEVEHTRPGVGDFNGRIQAVEV